MRKKPCFVCNVVLITSFGDEKKEIKVSYFSKENTQTDLFLIERNLKYHLRVLSHTHTCCWRIFFIFF